MSDFEKNRVLALYKILTAYTDEQHQISMQDILVHMDAEGYYCSEDSILRYIKQLRNAILLTREKTLPNISALMNTLMETDAKERVSKELLLEAIDDFEKDNIDSRECISEWKSKVAAETEMITKKAMKKILNMRTGIASKFNRFLHEKYGVWIDGELRKGEFEATYQIGNLLNIKYEYNEKDYLDGRTFVYYVGAKSKRLAYPNACCMRKVISLGEELEYEEALPLMAVEFVRNSQYTVLPFPFKYLREYIEQC